jgi:hypothetical protein
MNLTDEQVENWRKVLIGMFGPYAMMMSRAQIEAYAEKVQEFSNELAEKGEEG